MNTKLHSAYLLRTTRFLGVAMLYILGLLSTVATGGGGNDNGGGGATVNQAPSISELELALAALDYLADAGDSTVTISIAFSDPEADIATLHVETSDGASVTTSVTVSASSGRISGEVPVSTDQAGDVTIEVWVVDGAGNSSNRLNAMVHVNGSTELADLSLTDTELDPVFDAATDEYSAVVDFDVTTISATATLLEPEAALTIDAVPVPSGAESSPIDLDVGDNSVILLVTSSDGAMQTIEITVQRRANVLLSDLTFSAGSFDQIFQADLFDYTGNASFLRSTTTVTAVPEDPDATVALNGISVSPEWVSGDVDLMEGQTTIEVLVTGSDGNTTATYALEISRESLDGFAQDVYAKASNAWEEDEFGWSVAMSGNTLAVGAPSEWGDADGIDGDESNNDAIRAGAVYVFVRDPVTGWSQEAYIKASNSGEFDHFGYSLALSGDTLAVGAYTEWSSATGINGNQDDNSADSAGAVYVFTRDPALGWSQQAYIKASNTNLADRFGHSVALSGDTLVVGATWEESAASGVNGDQANTRLIGAGAAYVFTRDAMAVWSQQAYLKATNPDPGDLFGSAVAISGDLLAVGATGEASAAQGINGDQSDNSAGLAGAVYVYARDVSGQWQPDAYLKASNAGAVDYFGGSLSFDQNTLAVGARGEDSAATGVNGDQSDETDRNAGAAYLFSRSPAGEWAQEAYVKASNPDEEDAFGSSVALTHNALLVGARYESSGATGLNGDETDNAWPEAGAAYLFLRSADGQWTHQAYLKASNTYNFDNFGWSVALTDDALAVGARNEHGGSTGIDGNQNDHSASGSGAVYGFR
jgi:hypothetical protein